MNKHSASMETRPVAPAAVSVAVPVEASQSGLWAGHYRWVICALLFFGTTKNYMDRSVLAVLKITLQNELHWNEIDYSNIVLAFQAAYAVGMLLVGRMVDRLGTRIGYTLAVLFWSVASMAHAACRSLGSFVVARAALGLGESGTFPASIKSVAEWFPKKERAFATGIFNAGTNIGAILTPLIIPAIVIRMGWRGAFVVTGALSFVWIVFWLVIYRRPEEHVRCSKAELAYIRSDPQESSQRTPWRLLLPCRQTWAFVTGKFLTDPIWWFYLFWVPGYLQQEHGLNLSQIGLPLVVIYLLSDLGSVAGGWFPSWFIKGGGSVNGARKTAMLLCALAVLPVMFVYRAQNLWTAVLLIGLAAAAHQGFSANLFTLSSDMFPSHAVGSVVGIGGMAGAIGGMLIAKVVGYTLQWSGSYKVPFVIAGLSYLVAVGLIHLLSPRLEPANFDRR